MSKIPVRVTSFKDHCPTILSVQDKYYNYTLSCEIIELFNKYTEIMKPYYHDVCERVFLARSAIHLSPKNGYITDFSDTAANMKLVNDIVDEMTASYNNDNEDININLLRYMVNHIFKIIIDFLGVSENRFPTFASFWNYAWRLVKSDIDIAFSVTVRDKEIVYKINLPYKSLDKVIWHRWVVVKLENMIDPDALKCINTGKNQDITKVSQHLEISRLRIKENKCQLCFKVKKETPERNKNNVIMSIDKGFNHFLAYHVESYNGASKVIDHCANKELVRDYYQSIDSGNKEKIYEAKYRILKYAVDDLINKIKTYKPRFIILENMVGKFENISDKYVRSFPWVDFQKIIRRKAAEAGVHIIMVYDNCTSRDYALGDDIIIRNERNRSKGYCKKTGQKVCCDENAALNIWGRGVVKILEYYVLTSDQFIEVKSFVKSKGRTVATVNYLLAKEVIDFCRARFGIHSF